MRDRWRGLSPLVGGAIIGIAAVLLARRPAGIPGGPHRESDDLGLAMLFGMLLLLPGIVAIRSRHPPGRPRQAGTAAVGLAAIGLGISVLAVLGMAGGMPVPWPLPIMGALGVWFGTLLTGIAALRTGVLSRGVAALLVVSTLLLFLFNTEDARALLALPFASAWVVAGYALLFAPPRGAQ
jgi:hypothetical protein